MRRALAVLALALAAAQDDTPPLIEALVAGDVARAGALLAQGADVSELSVITPLYAAQENIRSAKQRRAMLRRLIALGAEPDQPTQDGTTTLMLAAYHGELKDAQLLLDAGADPRRTNDLDSDAIDAAARGGHSELAAALREQAGAAGERQAALWAALVRRVEAHVGAVHAELEALYVAACQPDDLASARLPSPSEQRRGDVNVPSCHALRTAGLEEYYGNVNMLMVCLLYTSPSPRDVEESRMPSSA